MCRIFASLLSCVKALGAASFHAPLLALPSSGWSFLQQMLPIVNGCYHDSPCSCMIKFGDVMGFLGIDADAPTSEPHELLKVCKDWTLQSQKLHGSPDLRIEDGALESVLAACVQRRNSGTTCP
jgi:hypothetical protein